MKKAKENWVAEECSESEENTRKNNSKKTYQLVLERFDCCEKKRKLLQYKTA